MSLTTKERLERLNDAISQGILEVEFDGRKVRYRNLDDMLRIRKILEREISGDTESNYIKVTLKQSY